MFRTIFALALLCVLSVASATNSCKSNYCWLSEPSKIKKVLVTKCGGWTYKYLKGCTRSGKSGKTCRCGGGGGGPSPTRNPPPPPPGPPSGGPGKYVSCGTFVKSDPKKSGPSGGAFKVAMKMSRGYFNFIWATYVIRDKFVITQGSYKIFDSDYVMGTGSNSVYLNGLSQDVTVRVFAPKLGSIWDFVAECASI